MKESTRRGVVLGVAAIVIVLIAVLTGVGWDPVVRIWDKFRQLSPLRKILAIIPVVGALPLIDFILKLTFPPKPDTSQIVQNFDKRIQELWEDERRNIEKEFEAQQLNADER